jgi:hypothetical protein
MHRSYVLIIAAAIFIFSSGCSRHSTNRALDRTVGTLTTMEGPTRMVADYQPWFGDRQHINVGYSTQDPEVLRRQIQQAKDVGVYAFAVDWYGDRRPFLDRSYAILQQVASENNFHVALMYDETEEDNGHSTEDALNAFDKAYRHYIGPNAPGREAYLLYNGRPVIFIFQKRGHTDWHRVRQVVNQWESPPLLIIKDMPPQEYPNAFDGYYAWVHPGPRGWQSDGSEWGEQYLHAFYQRMRNVGPNKVVVGGVWPGFDDHKASWSLNRFMDRRCGKTFEDTLRIFRQYADGSMNIPFVMIATWNDYEEGTEIENGVSSCGPRRNGRNSGGE